MGRCSHGGGGVWSAIFKMARASLHFFSSRGIQLDLSTPHPLHKKFSPSHGIYRLNLFTVYFEEMKFLLGFSSFSSCLSENVKSNGVRKLCNSFFNVILFTNLSTNINLASDSSLQTL